MPDTYIFDRCFSIFLTSICYIYINPNNFIILLSARDYQLYSNSHYILLYYRCTSHIVQWAYEYSTYNVLYTLYDIHCTIYTVRYTLVTCSYSYMYTCYTQYLVHYASYAIHRTMYGVQCTTYIIRRTLYGVLI